MKISFYFVIFAVFLALFAFAQCPPAGGGSSGPTLKTITLDGNENDWAPVLANPLQVTLDGQFTPQCNVSPIDRDCTNNTNISGRDLAKFAWTYDSTNIYLFLKRFGSTSNTQTFYFYCDINENQRMDTGEKVFQVRYSGQTRRTDAYIYDYNAVDIGNGDSMVCPSAPCSDHPLSETGKADGYTIVGTLSNETLVYSNQNYGFSDGTGFESYFSWSLLGVPVGAPIYYHVSSSNTSNPSQVPAQIDDNLGGPGGGIGAFGFYLFSITPDYTENVAPSNPLVVEYVHEITNTGTFSDRYDLKATSNLSWRIDLYDLDLNTLMATDLEGDGIWDYVNPSYEGDSPSNGMPDTPVIPATDPDSYFDLLLRLTAPYGTENVIDQTILEGISSADPCLMENSTDTTSVGELILYPSPQYKSGIAGNFVNFGLRLINNTFEDIFDLRAISGYGWTVNYYTDPNGDGNPSDGVLFAVDLNGNGYFTDTGDLITSGYDTNSNNLPDLGIISNGSYRDFVIQIRIPLGTLIGTQDLSILFAMGYNYGINSSAELHTTVYNHLTFFPEYKVSEGTNKYSGDRRSVFFAHTVINSWYEDSTISLSSTNNYGWSVRYYTDPNGDGNPSDGTEITSPFILGANGGSLNIVVEVIIPDIPPNQFPVTGITNVTVSTNGASASVLDEVRVSYLASFEDPLRSISQTIFARCDKIYMMGSSLVPSTINRYRITYTNPSSVVIRDVIIPTTADGDGFDEYTFTPTDQLGNWTLRLYDYSTLVDTIVITLDPANVQSTIEPVGTAKASYLISGENLTINAYFNNTSTGADYLDTYFYYLVRNNLGTRYLNENGIFENYSSGDYTKIKGPQTVPWGTSYHDIFTINNVTFDSPGVYKLEVFWYGFCGNNIANSDVYYFSVGATLSSFADLEHTTPEEYFGENQDIYLWGENYIPSHSYIIAFYDPNGNLSFQLPVESAPSGEILSSVSTLNLTEDGLWHAVIYNSNSTIPLNYISEDPHIVSSDTFIIDTIPPPPPLITSPTNGSSTTDTTPTITGTAEPNALVTVYINGVPCITYANDEGNWSYTPTTPLPHGENSIYATQTDLAGNTSGPSATVNFNVIYEPPVVNSPIYIFSDTISGTSTAPEGTLITIYQNGIPIGTTTVQAGGTWVLSGVSGLQAGDQITATAGTGAAQSQPSTPVVVIGDTDGDGIFDDIEGAGDTDGDGIPDFLDLDSDNDGIPDEIEGAVDTDGDGTYDFQDRDSDGDGIFDLIEGNDSNHDGITDYPVLDSNNDGMIDTILDNDGDGWDDNYDPSEGGSLPAIQNYDGDLYPDLRDPDDDGDGIPSLGEGSGDYDLDGSPNYLDADSDGDGILDQTEGSGNTADGDGAPNFMDLDSDGDGLNDSIEGTGDIDGDGIPNFLDPDSDGDGISDSIEGTTDTDGDGIPNFLDLDSDRDGIPDEIEGRGDSDGDTIPNYIDPDLNLDTDGDGIPDQTEGGGDSDGDGVFDFIDLDSDNDGIPDGVEGSGDLDGDGVPNCQDIDTDGDGIFDLIEGNDSNHDGITDYPVLDSNNDGMIDTITDNDGDGLDDNYDPTEGGTPALLQDTDGDGPPDWKDLDDDGDGIPSLEEGSQDTDRDGTPNYLDLNSDGDPYPDSIEGTEDSDGDSIPNFLDPDLLPDGDSDGIPDGVENGADLYDFDGDGTPNYQDTDSDGDGIPDSTEGATDRDGDGIPNYLDLDSDNDGIPDGIELTNDPDLDGIPNYLDTDSDGDGISDGTEKSLDADEDGTPNYLDTDSDNDGILDSFEGIADNDRDGVPNYIDLDSDNDGIPDLQETGGDFDLDGIPNTYDRDSDGDGLTDTNEGGGTDNNGDGVIDGFIDTNGDGLSDVLESTPLPLPNTDGEGGSDFLDIDSDGDGLSDNIEGFEPNILPTGQDGDGDGIDDAYDPDSGGTKANEPDYDSDSIHDFKDPDDDNDGIQSTYEVIDGEVYGNDVDGDGVPNWYDIDSDGDGVLDEIEGRGDRDGDGIPEYLDQYGIPNLLRNDKVISLSSYNPSEIFVKYPENPSLDGRGTNGISEIGEGERLEENGSSDDDDFYFYEVPSEWIDPDPSVLTDNLRPLVFYDLSSSNCTLFLTKEGNSIKITYTCN